jgi:enediyne biosynthesis protein E4
MKLASWPLALLLATQSSDVGSLFREVPPSESGITWIHENARSNKRYLPETSGPGVALFDYNNDGRMDILLVNSGTSSFYTPASPLRHALYRNNSDGTFTDVTRQAGITADLFGQGVATGDYDGDGWQDILITGYGKLVLYHNNHNGTFSDATEASGLRPPKWGTSAVWFDYDNDGKLDVFIGEFADYSKERVCTQNESYGGDEEGKGNLPKQQSYYCHPKYLPPWPSHLYRNLGQGKFQDVSQNSGIQSRAGKAWGVVAADINGDGYMDLFVANDTMVNYLWVNRHGEKFEELGLESGVGYSADGMPRSGMGVDAADFDRDGRVDLIVANINGQTTSLYRNIGNEMFEDVNTKTGLAPATRLYSGWGLGFFDYDNDGWPDLILSNGHPNDLIDQSNLGFTYREPILLLHNVGGEKLDNVGEAAGNVFRKDYPARGLAIGDLNNDGYADVVFTESGGVPHVLMNNAVAKNHWLGLQLAAKATNPSATGAILRWSIAGKEFSRRKNAGGSFLSTNDPREIIGAGKGQIDWVEVQWPAPSRRRDRITAPQMDRYLSITEGEGNSPN